VTYRPFIVPDDEDIGEKLGLVPIAVAGEEPTVRRLLFENESGEQLDLVIDILGRSIRCRVQVRGTIVYDIFREGAVQMLVHERPDRRIIVEFETEGVFGSLNLVLADPIRIDDRLLFR
jgi:hypothetical protein